ncbi:hypothetical protein CGI80_25685, partial [Vibrio parahaemolyticus]
MEVLKRGTLTISAYGEKDSFNYIDDIESPNKIFVVGEEKYFTEMKEVLNEDGLIEYKALSSFEDKWTKPKKQISKMGLKISELVR